ncbi:MAG TPA: arginine deiminase-related protein [Candidatus Polarisedimenticolaceae bacterium]|nr:arginine deiminase-related protein [Candidatus Polarisedimenticolaceae bacterium]
MATTKLDRPPLKSPAVSDKPSWLNRRVLVSDARHLESKGINAYENIGDQPDLAASIAEHEAAIEAYKQVGIQVEQVPSPENCQDGVFTANWGLTWKGRALLSRLPNLRQGEEGYAGTVLEELGFETRRADILFSGQGDALIIGGGRVLIGDGYRSNAAVGGQIRDWLGLEPVVVRAKPKRRFGFGPPVRNKMTGLWDSYYYDLDLAVAVIKPDLLAVCFGALTSQGKAAIHGLTGVEIIPVSEREAKDGLACNLVSTEQTVIVSDGAPGLIADIRARGIEVVALPNRQLRKSGGGFRCVSLSLYQ